MSADSAESIELLRKSLISASKNDEVEGMKDVIAQLQDVPKYSAEAASDVAKVVVGITKKYSDAALYGNLVDKCGALMRHLKTFAMGAKAAATSNNTSTTTLSNASSSTISKAKNPSSSSSSSSSSSNKATHKPPAAAISQPSDPIRLKMVNFMTEDFKRAGSDASIASIVAVHVEREINQLYPSVTNKASYMEKSKFLTSMLKINLPLILDLHQERVSYPQLLTMSASDLAPQSLKKGRLEIVEEDRMARDSTGQVQSEFKRKIVCQMKGMTAEEYEKHMEDRSLFADDLSEDEGVEVDCDDD